MRGRNADGSRADLRVPIALHAAGTGHTVNQYTGTGRADVHEAAPGRLGEMVESVFGMKLAAKDPHKETTVVCTEAKCVKCEHKTRWFSTRTQAGPVTTDVGKSEQTLSTFASSNSRIRRLAKLRKAQCRINASSGGQPKLGVANHQRFWV